MLTDIRLAVRLLARAPGFSIIAILTLALGIGLSASSFSLANVFLLRNVPYPEADRLVRIFRTSPESRTLGHATGNALDIRENATSFEGLALFNGDAYSLGEPGEPAQQVSGVSATAEFFRLMRLQPTLGRGFAPGDDEPGAARVAVISHRTWLRRYAGDPAVIGRSVRLNTEPHTIVGVLAESFRAPLVWGDAEFFTSRTVHPDFHTNRTDAWIGLVGRLAPGVGLGQAQAELDTLAARLRAEFPKENANLGLRVVGLSQSNMDTVSRVLLWLMTGISLAMMLIACANLASLQVARAFVRSREYAVRAALGGNRRQLMTPLIIESLVLAAAGGILGLGVAWVSNTVVGANLLINNEPGFQVPIDIRVLGFAALAALVSGLAFGLAPAWLASRTSAADMLKDGARGSTGGREQQRLKRFLIVGEMALAVALVGVAAAFGVGAKSFLKRDYGWNIHGLFTGFIAMPYSSYSEPTKVHTFQRDLLERLHQIPGVEQAVLANGLPLYSLSGSNRLVIEGQAEVAAGQEPTAEIALVSADYFRALGIALRRGRGFSDDLDADDPPVVVINQAMADRFWPGEDPLGKRLRRVDDEQWWEVIGVVNDVGMAVRLDRSPTPFQLYRPLPQATTRYFSIVLRSPLAPELLERPVGEAVAALDPDLPVAQPGSLQAQVDRGMGNLNLVIYNLGLSAGMGLLIAAVGLFGVISQLTAQRTRDIGVRIALGAQNRDILRMVLGEGLKLLAIGLVLGVPAYYALTLIFSSAMPQMQLPGWWLLITNLVVLSATMFIATYVPALRATKINPIDALRAE